MNYRNTKINASSSELFGNKSLMLAIPKYENGSKFNAVTGDILSAMSSAGEGQLGSLLNGVGKTIKDKGIKSLFTSGAGSFGDFAKGAAKGVNVASLAGVGGDLIASLGNRLGKENSKFDESQQKTQSAIRAGLSMIPVVGPAIALATGAMDALGSLTGTNLSNINKDSANRLGMSDAAGFNNAVNHLPGVSMFVNGVGAIFGGGRTDDFKASKAALSTADDYGATTMDLTATQDIAGKNLFGNWRKLANERINSARESDKILAEIGRTNTQRKQSDYAQDLQIQNINRYAGQNYRGMVVGKSGLKLMSVEEARKIIALKKPVETEDVTKLQNGGNIPGIDTNILPEGSLHKELNHLSDVNPDLEDATKKGVPVMAAEGGEISEQVAEVEREELVFRLEITQKLEELMKDGSEEAMIEAGKLIAQEVIENTQDNTGQITEENGNSDFSDK